MTAPVDITTLANLVGRSVRQIRRDLAAGAPAARRGRGRGRKLLIEPTVYAAWCRGRSGESSEVTANDVRLIAAGIPDLLARSVDETFRATQGPHKLAMADPLCGLWYRSTTAVLDSLRTVVADIPEVNSLPEQIERLSKM